MEHSESLTTNAAERYLLEEMSAGERDAFEEHYFDCAECAVDVRDGARMMAAGREILREPTEKKILERPKRSFTSWMPQAAAAGIIGGVMGWYGAVNTAAQKVATIEPAAAQYDILMEHERSAADGPAHVRAGKTVILNFSVPTSDAAASYVSSIRDAAGKTVYTEALSLDQAADPISLVVRALPGGSYQVVIEGVRKDGHRFPIAKSPFEVVSER